LEECGFTFKPFAPQYEKSGELHVYFIYGPDGKLTKLDEDPNTCMPFIDLNNLFRYAVDWEKIETIQFSFGDDGHHCWLYLKKPSGRPFHGYGETDEEALFWALRRRLI